MAASYEARAFGVRGAMGGTQARRLCPHAVVVEPRMAAYAAASRDVFDVFADTTPLVEGISIDEAFLDVAGLRRISGTPEAIATRLRAEVWDRVGLRITVGVARTKFLAKVASGVAKPDGLLVVEPDAESTFLYPLTVERLWGVGQKTAEKLHDVGITTVAQVAQLGEASLVSMVGLAAGRTLHALAHHRDRDRCRPRRAAGRWGRSARSGAACGQRKRSTPSSAAWSTASRTGCATGAASGAPWCSGCGSTTSPGSRGRAPCRSRPRRPGPSASWRGGSWSRRARSSTAPVSR